MVSRLGVFCFVCDAGLDNRAIPKDCGIIETDRLKMS